MSECGPINVGSSDPLLLLGATFLSMQIANNVGRNLCFLLRPETSPPPNQLSCDSAFSTANDSIHHFTQTREHAVKYLQGTRFFHSGPVTTASASSVQRAQPPKSVLSKRHKRKPASHDS